MALQEYKSKRDFEKTTEPKDSKSKLKNIFVVQRHDARNLHYDFRLQIGQTLKSWAIPKGIPEKAERKLAVETEDHPLEYANFEGKIPEGNYGAGTVEIFDKGTFENTRKISVDKSYEEGKIEVLLKGKKLNEKFVLIRMKPNEKYPSTKNWLIMRMKS
jgi:DNA ligase D-like protein (predicted 3'-phosphoesterase)